MCRCGNVQMLARSGSSEHSEWKCENLEMWKCENVQMCKCLRGWFKALWAEGLLI